MMGDDGVDSVVPFPTPNATTNGIIGGGIQSDLAPLGRIATNGQLVVEQLGKLIGALGSALPFSGSMGSFRSTAAASTAVANAAVGADSYIAWSPTNAAAAALDAGATAYYVSSRTPLGGFVVTTANGASAVGTEQFSYVVITPAPTT